MAIETRSKRIGDATYEVSQFPARRALRMQARLLKVAGPAIASMVRGTSEEIDFGRVVTELVDRLDEFTVEALVMDLLKCTRRDGKEIVEASFDIVFAGNLTELVRAIGFVLEVNFGDFLAALTGKAGDLADLIRRSGSPSSEG